MIPVRRRCPLPNDGARCSVVLWSCAAGAMGIGYHSRMTAAQTEVTCLLGRACGIVLRSLAAGPPQGKTDRSRSEHPPDQCYEAPQKQGAPQGRTKVTSLLGREPGRGVILTSRRKPVRSRSRRGCRCWARRQSRGHRESWRDHPASPGCRRSWRGQQPGQAGAGRCR